MHTSYMALLTRIQICTPLSVTGTIHHCTPNQQADSSERVCTNNCTNSFEEEHMEIEIVLDEVDLPWL